MGKGLLATLVAINIGLIGATCDPNNQPPNAPKARVAEYDATSITIVFGNNCIDPDNTGWCHQQVIVTGGGQSAFTIKATGGVAVIPNRLPGKEYDIFPYHVDEGGARTNGATIHWQTAGTSGPIQVGVVPTEIVVPAGQAWVYGVGFTATSTFRLLDPTSGVSYPLPILGIASNRATVAVPKPAGLIGRKPYFIVANPQHKGSVRADIVYLSASATDQPATGQKGNLSFIRWAPSGRCGGLLCGECFDIDGWFPPARDALRAGAGAPAGDDWWPDQWTDTAWSLLKTHVDDAGREWDAACSQAWGSATSIGGFREIGQRVTLPGRGYWFSILDTDGDIYRVSERKRADNTGNWDDFCTEDGGDNARTMPADCYQWKPNDGTHTNVHWVGAFYRGTREISPTEMRGITDPYSVRTTNYRGMIIVSDNQALGTRPKTKSILVNGVPQGECIAHYNNLSDPTGIAYSLGPNLATGVFFHESHHEYTGYVHDANGVEPDPCYTPAVGKPTDACPRGLDMNLGGSLTASYMCKRAADSSYTN